MDLLNVLRTLRRFMSTTITVAVLTLGAIALLVFAAPKVYEVDATYVLVNPSIPSDLELTNNPALATENRNNPYLRFTSTSMVGQVLATRMSSDDVRIELLGQGVSDEYVVSPSNDFGGAGQIVNVAGVGATPGAASQATKAIVARMTSELRSMQKVYGAADRYLITLIPIEVPGEATRVVSGQLRSVIAVGGVGLIILFVAISIRQAMEARPKEPGAAAAPPDQAPADVAVAADSHVVAAPLGSRGDGSGAIADGVAPNPPVVPVPAMVDTSPDQAPATRLIPRRTRPLHLADDLEAVSSFRQRDDGPERDADLPAPRTVP